MVHFLKHNYQDKDYFFLWDVESGSLHNMDSVAFLCAKKRYDKTLSPNEEIEYKKISSKDKDEINAFFNQMEESGSLNSPPRVTYFKKNPDIVKALCLNICHDCNMRCAYCFAKDGSYNTAKEYMTFEVAKKAVDFLIENSGERRIWRLTFLAESLC